MKDLSKKNPYWIEHNRRMELKYFCLQYPIWKRALTSLNGLSQRPDDLMIFKHKDGKSPTERCAEAREFYKNRMLIVERAARAADVELMPYILIGVTEGLSYETLNAKYEHPMPCCRDVYYDCYRKFFYILDKMRE